MWRYPLSPVNGWKVSRVFLRNITRSPGALSVSSSMLLRQKSCRKKINALLANEKHCWDYSSYSLKSKSSLKPPMTIWQVVCWWKKTQAKLSSYFICMSCAHSSSHLQKKRHMQYFVNISKQKTFLKRHLKLILTLHLLRAAVQRGWLWSADYVAFKWELTSWVVRPFHLLNWTSWCFTPVRAGLRPLSYGSSEHVQWLRPGLHGGLNLGCTTQSSIWSPVLLLEVYSIFHKET